MNMKTKLVREKDTEHNHRYKTLNNYDSTPSLSKGRQQLLHYNKENKQYMNNRACIQEQPKFAHFDPVKSMNLPRRMQTSMNEQELGQFKKNKNKLQAPDVICSQELGNLRYKKSTEPAEEPFFKGQHVTFGDANYRKGLLSSREFIEEKKMKNEVIDEMMATAHRSLCKSFNQLSLGGGHCVNHPNKKAKYRLLSQLSEGEEEMFYCSKCAINLLQQGFRIEQIKGEEVYYQNSSARLQQITKFELKLKSIQERARFEAEHNYSQEQLQMIEEEIQSSNQKFETIISSLEQMRNDYISNLNQLLMQKKKEEKTREEDVHGILSSLRDIQQEIKEYKNANKFAIMKENQFQFINSSLNSKLNKFEEELEKMKPSSPCRRLSIQSITEQKIVQNLREECMTVRESVPKRRERQITFSRRLDQRERMSEDDFACDELKRPFRVLFPSEQMESNQSTEGRMLSSVRERPTIQRYQ